jgi:hypothetical protein
MTVDTTGTRRNTNKVNALALAKIGVAVFPSSGKVPLVPAYHTLDASFTPEQRAAEIESYQEDHDGKEPKFVGCTTSVETIKAMWRAFPDAVPSIACGPSKLVVLDADTKNNGPELIGALFAEHGGVPEGTFISTTRSGGQHFVFSDPDSTFTNTEGMLGKKFGCNVRGRRGQFVAPGSIREDGKSYGTRADLAAFCRAVASKKLPTLPPYIVELIGASSSDHEQVAPSKEREIVAHLQDSDWPEFEDIFDATLGKYDLDKLRTEDDAFAKLHDAPSSDCSNNRFLAARALMRQWPNMKPEELAIFFERWDGSGTLTEEKPKAGEYDLRQIAREWLKNQGLSKPSSGDAFGVVDEPNEQEAYIANGGTVEGWEKWEQRLAEQRAERERRAQRAPKASETKLDHVNLVDLLVEPEDYTSWIVKNVLATQTTMIVAGLWGAGKTAVMVDMALHIAHGMSWRGQRVQRGVVLYAALENPKDVKSRVRAWCKAHPDVDFDPCFVTYTGQCTLFDQNNKPTQGEKRLISLANKAAKAQNIPVALVIIDTVSQAIIPGSDREHGSLFVASMQRIADATGACVTALHHPTKAGDEVRGDGAFQGNVDGILLLKRDLKTGLGSIKASSQKFRVGDPRKVNFGYRLTPVVVGKDEDGEDRTVVIATEAAADSWQVDEEGDDGDEGQNVPPPPDTPGDRPAALLRVIRERVELIASNTGDAFDEISLQAGEALRLWNAERKRSGLTEITDPAICSRLLTKLVDGEELVRVGENRRSMAYRLPAGKV